MRISSQDYRWLKSREHNLPVKKKDNPEGRLQLAILKYLRSKGYACGKTKTTGIKRGNSFCFDPYLYIGFPDVTAFCPHLVFIEVKSPTGKQSEAQQEFQFKCERAGVAYILARSLDDVLTVIKP